MADLWIKMFFFSSGRDGGRDGYRGGYKGGNRDGDRRRRSRSGDRSRGGGRRDRSRSLSRSRGKGRANRDSSKLFLFSILVLKTTSNEKRIVTIRPLLF